MKLHAIAAPIVAAVNPPVRGQLRRSTGYTTGASGKREPTYADDEELSMQVQGLTGPELKLVDGLNIQGLLRSVHLPGDVKGVDRKSRAGGDLIAFDDGADIPPALSNTVWLVELVHETWDTSDWCRVIISKQLDNAVPPDPGP